MDFIKIESTKAYNKGEYKEIFIKKFQKFKIIVELRKSGYGPKNKIILSLALHRSSKELIIVENIKISVKQFLFTNVSKN